MAEATKPRRVLRPRNAASLVLVDLSRSEPRFLMGRRPDGHVFMAGKRVFPGGRLERADSFNGASIPVPPHDLSLLKSELGPTATLRRALAFAHCAVRETDEETGLVLAEDMLTTPLRYLARAVTPPGMPRRFDTRFFMAGVSPDIETPSGGDGELTEIGWYTAAEREDELHRATRYVLSVVQERLRRDPDLNGHAVVPFMRVIRGTPTMLQRHTEPAALVTGNP